VFFSPRISTRELALLCRRLATSLQAGVDVRTVWSREAGQATRPATRSRLRTISEGVSAGQSLPEAISGTDDFFPEMFRELVVVGDQTGHLAESFEHLAHHYDEQLRLRRTLLTASAWPLFELGIALGVIGLAIWILGWANEGNPEPIDPLGLGLMGTSGLMVYLAFLAVVAAVLFGIFQAIRRGMLWTRPIQRLLIRLPGVGQAFEKIALARLAWSMHLTLDAGMGLRQALKISLRSTRSARYTDHLKSIDAEIEAGNPIAEAFDQTRAFPHDFLDAVRTGEHAGRLVETMGILSGQYREQAEAALRVLALAGGVALWIFVACFIAYLVLRFYLVFYLGIIYDLSS
jgi:protein transport protein HofC